MKLTLESSGGHGYFTRRFYYHDTASAPASPADEGWLAEPFRVPREGLGGTA